MDMKKDLTTSDNQARVFVIQDMGFDYRDARQNFGAVHPLLKKSEVSVHSTAACASLLKKRLWDMEFSDDDYLLAIGAPAMMILAGYLAMQQVQSVLRVLQWSKVDKAYYVVELRK